MKCWHITVEQRRSSSHDGGSTQHQLTARHATDDAAAGDGQTAKQVSVEEELRLTDDKDGQRDVTSRALSNDVTGATHPVTWHASTSRDQCSTSCVQPGVDDDPRPTLQPPPSAFLAPLPYPFHLCPSPYMTSFPPPLYPVRPRPLTPMTHFRVMPFDGCVEFQAGGGGSSGSGEEFVDDRRCLLGDVSTSPWWPRMVGAHCASSMDVDQAKASTKSSADCRDDVNDDVDALRMIDDVGCDHIDVDTVDDSTPSLAAEADGLHTPSLGII